MMAREQDVLRRAGEASVLIQVSLADGSKHGYAQIHPPSGSVRPRTKPAPPCAGSPQLSLQGTAHARSC